MLDCVKKLFLSVSVGLATLFCAAPWSAFAQIDSDTEISVSQKLANERVKKLKKGTLAVVLYDQKNKINAIDSLLTDDDLSEKAFKNLMKERKRAVKRSARRNQEFISAFEKNYDYSEFVFIKNHLIDDFLEDPKSPVFFKSDEEELIALESSEGLFFLVTEKLSMQDNAPATVLQFQTASLHPLSKPFPNNYMLNFAIAKRSLKNIVDRINRDLNNFQELKNY